MFKATLLLSLIFVCIPFAIAQTPKNILLIAVDDLNDYTGLFGGHPQAHTPNIDALAAKGTRFQKAYSASPVCNSSRAALLTGRRPHETGITHNSAGNFRKSKLNWVTKLETMPQYFTARGYKTASVGKIFHKPEDSINEFLITGGRKGGQSVGKVRKVSGTKLIWSEGDEKLESTREWKNADYGVNFLQQKHEQPFFLAVGFFRPHLPWHAPKQFFDLLPDIEKITLPAYLENDLDDTASKNSNGALKNVLKQGGKKLWQETVRAYLANVAFTDAAIGHLLSSLEASPYAQNTIVVFFGDHGWHLGEKDHYQKSTNWERASKTTFVIYDPIDGKSSNIDHAVSLQDIWPTLVSLTSTQPPNYPIRGRNLAPLIKNPSTNWNGTAMVTFRGHNSIFSDRYHYIDLKGGELYDLKLDPHEWKNRIDDPAYAKVKAEMKAGLEAVLRHDEIPFKAPLPGPGKFLTKVK